MSNEKHNTTVSQPETELTSKPYAPKEKYNHDEVMELYAVERDALDALLKKRDTMKSELRTIAREIIARKARVKRAAERDYTYDPDTNE